MSVLTRDREALLSQLVAVAEDPTLVERALRELNETLAHAPTMRDVIRRILELKYAPPESLPTAGA